MDLPMITEATSEFYRNIGPIFKGINMVILRNHVSYFIYQLTMFDTPMTQRQIEYLKKVHTWVVQEHHVTQRHYDIMIKLLMEAMRTNGAQDDHLRMVQAKLDPLRSIFPPEDGSAVVATQEGQQQQPAKSGGGRQHGSKQKCPHMSGSSTPVPGCVEHMGTGKPAPKPAPTDGERTYNILGRPHPSQKYRDQINEQKLAAERSKRYAWLRRLACCMRPS